MPYRYNINSYDPAEYTSKAKADSVYGKRGAMRATKNQSLNRATADLRGGGGGRATGGTPYEQFKASSMEWAAPTPAGHQATGAAHQFAGPRDALSHPSSGQSPFAGPRDVAQPGAYGGGRFNDPAQLAEILSLAGGFNGPRGTNGMNLIAQPARDNQPTAGGSEGGGGGFSGGGGGGAGAGGGGGGLPQNQPVEPPPTTTGGGGQGFGPGQPGGGQGPFGATPQNPPVQPPPAPAPTPNPDAPPDGYWSMFNQPPPNVPAPVLPAPPTPTGAPPDTTLPPQRTDAPTWRDAVMPNMPDHGAILDLLNRQYGPQNEMGQQRLTNILRGQAALTGDSNAGGFSEVLGRQQAGLIADQQANLMDKSISVTENARDRALEQYKTDSDSNLGRYGIDADRFTALLRDDTERYGIKTNADMERYLADRKMDLEKYGIDVDAVMEKYRTDSSLAGTVYSADQAFNAAKLDAIIRDQISRRNENTEWGRINLDRYGIDTRAGIDWAGIAALTGLTPQDLARILGGFTP